MVQDYIVLKASDYCASLFARGFFWKLRSRSSSEKKRVAARVANWRTIIWYHRSCYCGLFYPKNVQFREDSLLFCLPQMIKSIFIEFFVWNGVAPNGWAYNVEWRNHLKKFKFSLWGSNHTTIFVALFFPFIALSLAQAKCQCEKAPLYASLFAKLEKTKNPLTNILLSRLNSSTICT